MSIWRIFLFFQAEDGIRVWSVTGVQSCALSFSSRRRHTRLVSDWSSDVCSSDLIGLARHFDRFEGVARRDPAVDPVKKLHGLLAGYDQSDPHREAGEIGRASCRERV